MTVLFVENLRPPSYKEKIGVGMTGESYVCGGDRGLMLKESIVIVNVPVNMAEG